MWFQVAFIVFLTFEIKQNVADVNEQCSLPSETGPCEDYSIRWYYDVEIKRCLQFPYGGCAGNKNNYESRQDCQIACDDNAAGNLEIKEEKHSNINLRNIIYEETLDHHQHPWMVALNIITYNGSKFCAGTLIGPEFVLTSSYCIDNATEIEVVMGAYNVNNNAEIGQVRMTSKVTFQHDECTKGFRNDIGLVKLPGPVTFSDSIKAIKLYPLLWGWDGDKIDLPGWGRVSSGLGPNENLTSTIGIITIEKDNKCSRVYPRFFDHERNLCVLAPEGQNKCNRDDGGPVIFYSHYYKNYYIVGVGSFSISAGCGESQLNVYPDVYIQTHGYADWLNKYTKVTDKHFTK